MKSKNGLKRIHRVLRLAVGVTMITAVLAVPALADESWSFDFGTITYEKDIGNTAVFSYPTPGFPKSTSRLFINGLVPDIMGNRTSYSGYWVDNSGLRTCEAALVDPLGRKTNNWGRFEITFKQEADGYWAWTGKLAPCFTAPFITMIAKPVRG